MTVNSHATALYNGTGIFILLFSLATFRHVHKLEIFGYLLFGVGIIWLVTDTHANKTTPESNILSGNLVALLGAAFGAIHCLLMQRSSRAYHPVTLLTHCFCFSSVYQLILFPHFTSYENFYSFDAELGAFGWLGNFPNFIHLFCVVVPLTGILGNIAYLYAYKYFTLEIITVAILLEPFIAQAAAVMLGQDYMPGQKTLVGLLIITAGSLMAFLGNKYKVINEINKMLVNEKL